MLNSNNINYIKYKFSAGKAAATLANVTSLPFRLRFVMNNYRQTSSVISMMSQLGWEDLRLRRARIKTILLFMIVNNLVDIPPGPFLIPTGAITRGHNIRFLQPHTRTITMQYSFFPGAIRTWNTLPQQLASMTSLEGFRQALANTTIVP